MEIKTKRPAPAASTSAERFTREAQLTQIAILCKLNPDTAYNATVTFSDYLRGNMDSLKQTAPVPFTRELEHLKKYLYIEKLRFDDQLNIEYDIQASCKTSCKPIFTP